MIRFVGILFLVIFSAAAGAWLPTFLAGERAGGPDVRCIQISGQAMCKGQPITDLPWNVDRLLGGIVSVSCTYDRPGKTNSNGHLGNVPAVVRGCTSRRYVVSLSDGAVLTNFWVDDGRVAQIDRYDANPLDF